MQPPTLENPESPLPARARRQPRLPPLHPFAAAIYLVLALAAANREALILLPELLATVAIALVVPVAFWLLSRLLTRDRHRRGLVTLSGVLLVHAYARLRMELSVWVPSAAHEHGAAVVAWLLLLALATLAVLRGCDRLQRTRPAAPAATTRFLNVAALLLLVFPSLGLALRPALRPAGGSSPASGPLDPIVAGLAERPEPATLPDVYLIVLDKYTGSDALAESYGFDNTPFLDSLRDEGFFVPTRARANYIHTLLALPSLLNWTYLDSLAQAVGRDSRARQPAYELTEDNRAIRVFRQLGYHFVFVPTSFPATLSNRNADLTMPAPGNRGLVLRTAWLRITPLAAALHWHCRRVDCRSLQFPYEIESAARTRWKLREIARLAGREETSSPIFVFAHLLIPHEPYLFHADCSTRPPLWPPHDGQASLIRQAYVEQVTCTNRMLLELVRTVKRRSARPPVILLQADHGHGRIAEELTYTAWDRLRPEQVRDRVSVFAAYYLPEPSLLPADSPATAITAPYDRITPVNLLPIVLNRYAGAAIPLQPDLTFWSEFDTHFDFFRIDP